MKSLMDLIIYLASFLGAVGAISAIVTKIIKKMISSEFQSLNRQIRKLDVKECRLFLIDFLVDIEAGVEKNEVQWKFAHDVYDHYTNDLKENSYVKDFWERVMNSGHNE
jgi:hypothetical protein